MNANKKLFDLQRSLIKIDQMEQILKDIDKLDKKFAKLNQDRKMLMTALQAVCYMKISVFG